MGLKVRAFLSPQNSMMKQQIQNQEKVLQEEVFEEKSKLGLV